MQFQKLLNRLLKNRWIYPLTLLGVMLITYGLQLTRLGFYWDDWQALYLSRFASASAFWNFFLSDRPISSWTYILTMPILGLHPLAWQIFTLLMRWLSVMGFVWALSSVWPQQRWQVRWMGLLLAVYPGFSQQAISVAYSQHFISYALFTLSLAGMLAAIRNPQKYWVFTPLAFLASLLHMLTMEYFVGLELLRPLLLGFIFWSGKLNWRAVLKKVAIHWLPYLAALALFGIYRFAWLPGVLPAPDQNAPVLLQLLANQPGTTFLHLIQMAIQDSLHTSLFAWTNTITPETITLNVKFSLFSWFIGALTAGFITWGSIRCARMEETPQPAAHSPFTLQAITLGLAGLLLGGLPVWVTNRQVLIGAWSDRFTLAPMFGAVILLVALIDWLANRPQRKAVVLAALLGLSVAAHVRNSDKYADNWQLQRQYYWQMHWRAPSLTAGTAILGPEIPFSYVSGISLGFTYNILYDPLPESTSVPFWYIEALRYRNSNVLLDFLPDTTIQYKELRNIVFEGNTDQAVAVNYKAARGCVRVMDAIYLDAPYLSDYPVNEGELELYHISHTGQILAKPVTNEALMRSIFGKPPVDDWCYFYQQADLARQLQNWETIPTLYQQAETLGFQAYNGAEYIPFIEGYAAANQGEKALELTVLALNKTDKMNLVLCQTWERIALRSADNQSIQQTALDAFKLLQCK